MSVVVVIAAAALVFWARKIRAVRRVSRSIRKRVRATVAWKRLHRHRNVLGQLLDSRKGQQYSSLWSDAIANAAFELPPYLDYGEASRGAVWFVRPPCSQPVVLCIKDHVARQKAKRFNNVFVALYDRTVPRIRFVGHSPGVVTRTVWAIHRRVADLVQRLDADVVGKNRSESTPMTARA